jgi:hypothetical protein
MGAEIYQDTLDVESVRVAAEPARLEDLPEKPHIPLRLTEERRVMTLRTVVLENAWLRAVICPDLGGRLLGLQDRRTQTQPLPLPGSFQPVEGPPRGVVVPHGAEIVAGAGRGRVRPGSMARVRELAHEPEEEGGSAALFIHELMPASGLGWTACWSMPADRAELRLELRLANRTFVPVDVNPGLLIWGARMEQALPGGWLELETESGRILAQTGAESLGGIDEFEEGLALRFSAKPCRMGPRQILSQSFVLASGGALEAVSAAGRRAAISVDDQTLAIVAHEPLPQARIGITDRTGERHMATVDLLPDSPQRLELPHLLVGALRVDLEDQEQGQVVEWRADRSAPSRPSIARASGPDCPGLSAAELGFGEPLQDVLAYPAAALAAAAAQRMARGEWEEADGLLGESLQQGGGDVLTWVMKALVQQRLSPNAEERPESMAGHGLDPLEPMMRVEAWLAQGLPETRDPSPLLKPLAEDRELGLDAFHHLVMWGLEKEALRLADDLLRAGENPLLRLMMAWLLLTRSRMEAEAAQHVQTALAKGVEPPYPVRRREAEAIAELCRRFPSDERLRTMAAFGPQDAR